MSCSHFILQERGGASTARQYVKWGQGDLCIYNKSSNYELFNDFFNVEIIKFNDFMNLIYGIKNRNIDIISNAKKIEIEEVRSLKILKEYFC